MHCQASRQNIVVCGQAITKILIRVDNTLHIRFSKLTTLTTGTAGSYSHSPGQITINIQEQLLFIVATNNLPVRGKEERLTISSDLILSQLVIL